MPTSLLTVLRGLLPSLPKGPRKVAQHILADPGAVAGQSLEELARSTGTSESTVTRLAAAAGFRGYRELRTAIAVAAGAMVHQPEDRMLTKHITASDSVAQTVAKLLSEEQSALADTAATLSSKRLEHAAAMVRQARQVVVVGIASSGLVALDLAGKLTRIGLVARAVVEGHSALTAALVMRPGDLLVVISTSGTTRDAVEPFQRATERGVTTLAITANQASPLARADEVLMSVSAQDSPLRPAAMASRTAQMFAVDVLFTLVTQRTIASSGPAIDDSYVALAPRHHTPPPAATRPAAAAPTATSTNRAAPGSRPPGTRPTSNTQKTSGTGSPEGRRRRAR